MSRVLIVNMPFSNLRWPNLGPSLLKAALVQRGIGCDLAYLNFDFAERIGLDRYTWIADCFAFVLGGERLFAKDYFGSGPKTVGWDKRSAVPPENSRESRWDCATLVPPYDFGRQLPGDEEYCRDVLLAADPGLSAVDLQDYQSVQECVEPFLEAGVRSIDWSRYAIVGFAVSFQQTMPSVCLARRIKEIRPEIKIVFGGAACEGPMGMELLRQFPVIDYVFLGEADLTFPPLVEDILAGGRGMGDGWRVAGGGRPGVVGRGSPGAMPTPCVGVFCADAPIVRDLDQLPYPDFDDYFARLQASPLAAQIDPVLFFETSRGCWWGQKHHCKFCGLNGPTLAFRSKSPERVIDELRHLVDRHGVHRACTSDNILDHRYFKTLLPMLRQQRLDLAFVYEMKTNLTRRQVDLLMEAGLGAAQLGIETFLTPVLKLAGKGATALQNLQTLKWFSEAGIEVKWNLLYGFPGEDPADYAALTDLLPSLVHLAPPLAIGRVRLDRFSPYFGAPARYGIANPRPNRAFRHVYPFAEDSLARMAYYFEYDYADGRNPRDYAAPAITAAQTWQQVGPTATLRHWDRPDGVLILHDTRPCAAVFQHRLTGLDRRIYLFCDPGRTLQKIVEFAARGNSVNRMDEVSVRRLLDGWIAARLMVFLDGRYLSLALRAECET